MMNVSLMIDLRPSIGYEWMNMSESRERAPPGTPSILMGPSCQTIAQTLIVECPVVRAANFSVCDVVYSWHNP